MWLASSAGANQVTPTSGEASRLGDAACSARMFFLCLSVSVFVCMCVFVCFGVCAHVDVVQQFYEFITR